MVVAAVVVTAKVAPNLAVGEESDSHWQSFEDSRYEVAVFIGSVYKVWTLIERAVVESFSSDLLQKTKTLFSTLLGNLQGCYLVEVDLVVVESVESLQYCTQGGRCFAFLY